MHKSERLGFNWWNGESIGYRRAMLVAAKLAAKGLAVPVSKYEFVAERKPYCDNPVRVGFSKPARDAGVPIAVSMWAPCRKCPRCLLFRQMKWRQRCINEIVHCHNSGHRQWWVTLTFSPVHLAGIIAEAVSKYGSADLKYLEKCAYKHVQLYLDRLRKAAKTRFRYLAVYERGGETGRSHYHLLLHETGPRPLLKRQIEALWRSHVHARLVHVDKRSTGLASYISKYATKHVEVRPRASLGYGVGGPRPELPRVRNNVC